MIYRIYSIEPCGLFKILDLESGRFVVVGAYIWGCTLTKFTPFSRNSEFILQLNQKY